MTVDGGPPEAQLVFSSYRIAARYACVRLSTTDLARTSAVYRRQCEMLACVNRRAVECGAGKVIIRFDPSPGTMPGQSRTMVVRAGEWTIAILRRERQARGSAARWVIAEAFGYLTGDDGLAFATLFHARCWFICRLAQSGQSLLRGEPMPLSTAPPENADRSLH